MCDGHIGKGTGDLGPKDPGLWFSFASHYLTTSKHLALAALWLLHLQ